jgi:tetratricopeptide (TPR) repeat protein/arsenate reductase-like glutaredoxin family protein
MKKYTLLMLAILLVGTSTFAQQKPKPKEKEKPPTQKEMEEMMKEAQKELDNMSDEDKKMMKEMGIKIPSMKDVPQVTDKQLADAWENENRIVPKKDMDRIAAIPIAVTDGRMGAYITSTHNKTATLLKPEVKNMADKIYSYIKSKSKNSAEAGNMATGLWIAGKPQIAYYSLGKICTDDPTNTDNLSNYGAMLSMFGAQQLAIPILNNLNAKFPKNSTLLNNLGQAWFGLGDITKAEKYLDSVIRIYAYHPQATYTKSYIEESKGNKTEAVNLVKKSILHSYSKEKEDRLSKMGHKLTAKEVSLPKNTKADPLNLGGFAAPPFPMSVDQCIAMEPVWAAYRQQLEAQAAALKPRLEAAWQLTTDMQQKRSNENIAMVKASVNAGSPQGVLTLVPMHASAAYLKQNEVMDEYNRKMAAFGKKTAVFFTGTAVQLKRDYDATMEKLREEDNEQTGEGLPNKDFCPRYKEASDKYLNAYNGAVESFFKEHLEIQKKYLNEITHWQMYSEWPEKFEAHKLEAKIAWLGALTPTFSFKSITTYKCAMSPMGKTGKLSKFDDVACQYNDTLNLKIIKFTNNCSRMTSEFDFLFLRYVRKDDFERAEGDTYISSTYKISAEAGKDLKAGPLKVEAKVGAGIELEFGPQGIEDVTLIGEVKVGAGTGILDEDDKSGSPGIGIAGKDAFPTTVEAGVEGRISIISGKSTIEPSGIFKK